MRRESIKAHFLFWKQRSHFVISHSLNLLFPIRCVHCGAIGEQICARCNPLIQWIMMPFCQYCGIPGSTSTHHTCIDRTVLEQIRTATIFSGPIRKALHALKYRNNRSLANLLVTLSSPYWPIASWGIDCIVPIPMGLDRLKERGYNQAELIARSISELANIPMENHIIMRTRETRSQVGLALDERKRNLEGAFSSRDIQGRRILLVDDVCTTGATMQECAKALRKAGAVSVHAVAIARAVPTYLIGKKDNSHISQGETP